jgi:hypothetical protein
VRPLLAGIAESSPVTRQGAIRCAPATRQSPARIKHFVMAFVYPDPMEGTSEGLTDKLYWRRARGEWHCFRRIAQVRGYASLCQRREITIVHGEQIARPEADLRCSVCDQLEMKQRGWDGSGPASARRAGKSLSR